MKLFEFNPGSKKPPVHLAHANGFLPPTYRAALSGLLTDHHVFSFLSRPLWDPAPARTLRRWSRMSEDLAEDLSGLHAGPVDGIGHSLGGVLTLYASVRNPDLFKRLVLIDPTMLSPGVLWKIRWLRMFGVDPRTGLIQGALRRKRKWESREAAIRYFNDKPLFRNWPAINRVAYVESLVRELPEGGVGLVYPPEWEARIYQTIPTDVWTFARKISRPTLVIRGEFSDTFTAESEKAFRKVCPGAEFATVPGAGHLVPQEKPKEISRLIRQFLGSGSV